MEPKPLSMLGKRSVIELYPQPKSALFNDWVTHGGVDVPKCIWPGYYWCAFPLFLGFFFLNCCFY